VGNKKKKGRERERERVRKGRNPTSLDYSLLISYGSSIEYFSLPSNIRPQSELVISILF
jgi:hypothetical protein